MSIARYLSKFAKLLGSDGKVPAAALAAGAFQPAGMVNFFAMTAAPVGYLKANGAAVSRTIYADLFAAIGTTFGAGDSLTTFNLPDLRGEFVRGWTDGRSVDSGRAIGSFQRATLVGVDGPGGYNLTQPYSSVNSWENLATEQVYSSDYPNVEVMWSNATNSGTNRWATTDAGLGAARPRNVALLACIKF